MPTSPTTHAPLLRFIAVGATAALLLAMLAGPAVAHGEHADDMGRRGVALGRTSPGIGADLAAVRAATARYHDVAVALADGYLDLTEGHCVEHPAGAGAMGIHYVNPGRLGSDPAAPAALLYLPGPNGQLRLVGVEYIDFSGDGELFGQPFTDPVPHPMTGVPVGNAGLHVWLWQANPAGMFAAFNPNLSCPTA